MVHKRVSKLIMDLLYYKILRGSQSLFSCGRLEMNLKFIEHLLEYLHALLVPIVNLRQQREIMALSNQLGANDHINLTYGQSCNLRLKRPS